MRKALWLTAMLCVVGCSSGKKPEADANTAKQLGAGITPETKPLIDQANQCLQKREFGKAFEHLNAAIKLDQKCSAAYYIRAGIYADANQDTRAILDYNTCIVLEPKNAEYYNGRGLFLLSRQKFPPAVHDFSNAINLNPTHAVACNNRGLARVALGQFKEAVADFTTALKLNPKNHDAFNNRGYAYFQAGDSDSALQDYNSALKLKPDYLNAFNNKGLLYFKAEKYEESAAEFTAAIKLDRTNPKFYRLRREAFLKAGLEQEARADLAKINWLQELSRLNQLASRAMEDQAVWLERAYHLADGNEYSSSISDFEYVLKLNPKSGAAQIGLAHVYLKQGQTDKAMQACEQAAKLGSLEAPSMRGDIYLHLNKFDEAIAAYTEAQRFDAQVAEAYLLRSKQRQAAGKTQAAEEDYRQAIALDPSIETSRQ